MTPLIVSYLIQGREEIPQCPTTRRLRVRSRRNQTADHHRWRHTRSTTGAGIAQNRWRRRRLCLNEQFRRLLLLRPARSVRDVPPQRRQILPALRPGLPEQEPPPHRHRPGRDTEAHRLRPSDGRTAVGSRQGWEKTRLKKKPSPVYFFFFFWGVFCFFFYFFGFFWGFFLPRRKSFCGFFRLI